ncbi:SPW repeat domain-containing protein [Oceaniglobus roseus]|uniref:SPW repeat domain-containing protein n=1 Tax=Oceaniglobus roseus TaxID=1737570 RepID=UPI0012FFDC2D|nr:SPW repeat protein [Kandeliimicrobium roseum]
MQRMHWQDAVTLLTGLAIVIAALFLRIPPPEGVSLAPAIWNIVLSGLAATGLAVAALRRFRDWEEVAQLVLGLGLIAAPFVMGYSAIRALTWLSVGGGLVVAVMALSVLIRPSPTSIY